MKNPADCNIDNDTIRKVGLRIFEKLINAVQTLRSRQQKAFEYSYSKF